MHVEEAEARPETDDAALGGATGTAANLTAATDGRTRCAWVRDHPRHYLFHDAEFGRLPDSDPPCFERVLLACLSREATLTDLLDARMEIYEAFGEWDAAAVAGADDAALDALSQRGGIFADKALLRFVRDVAASCVATAKEYRTLRDYFLALPSLTPEETLLEMQARFTGFTKEDAANLMELMGTVPNGSHDRDCWIA